MQLPGYNAGNIILTEGNWYPFRITNLVKLQDNSWYYILLDMNGLKHFMPTEYYKEYGLLIGDEVSCKIDKINCTGRIFLEPRHPFYQEGKIYLFDVAKISEQLCESSLIVVEKFGNKIKVGINEFDKRDLFNANQINCCVISIKKGILILELCPSYS